MHHILTRDQLRAKARAEVDDAVARNILTAGVVTAMLAEYYFQGAFDSARDMLPRKRAAR